MRNTLKKVSLVCAVSVGTAMLLSGCGAIDTVITEVKAKFNTSETELAEGQRKAEITVMSIVGNELTYRENETEAPETEMETETGSEQRVLETEIGNEQQVSESETGSETVTAETMSSETGRSGRNGFSGDRSGEIPSGGFQGNSGEMPGGFPGGNSGEMSSGGFMEGNSGQMPGGVQNDDIAQVSDGEIWDGMEMSQMPDGMDMSQVPDGMEMSQVPSGEIPDRADMEERFAELTGETVYLPVSIKVHADNGKEATFSILEEGDVLQVLFETKEDGTEVITEIWMEGTY